MKIFSSRAMRFVIIVGIINMFADLTYEGGRSIVGPFMGLLGASAFTISLVSGIGEFFGYSLRLVSGYVADKTKKYWLTAGVGYTINMLAVPALALAGNWPMAAALIIAERTGRAIRRPAMEAMLSYTSKELGSGKVFGINEALDQAGATVGPLIVALVIFLRGNYRDGFAILLISALLCLGTVLIARFIYPNPRQLAAKEPIQITGKGYSNTFWLFVAAGALIAIGANDFSLISFHFQKVGSVTLHYIPLFYSVAMATGAITALVFGRLYDKIGIHSVILAFFIAAFSPIFVFLGGFYLSLIGVILWGIGLGAQDTLLKAILIPVISVEKRSTAFGLFDGIFGLAWLLGNIPVGLLYDISLPAVVIYSMTFQLLALPVFYLANRTSAFKK